MYMPLHFVCLKIVIFAAIIFIVTFSGKTQHPDCNPWNHKNSELYYLQWHVAVPYLTAEESKWQFQNPFMLTVYNIGSRGWNAGRIKNVAISDNLNFNRRHISREIFTLIFKNFCNFNKMRIILRLLSLRLIMPGCANNSDVSLCCRWYGKWNEDTR